VAGALLGCTLAPPPSAATWHFSDRLWVPQTFNSACALKRAINALLTSGGGHSRMLSSVALTNLRTHATSASVAPSATATCSSTSRASSSDRRPSTQSTSWEKATLFLLGPGIRWPPPQRFTFSYFMNAADASRNTPNPYGCERMVCRCDRPCLGSWLAVQPSSPPFPRPPTLGGCRPIPDMMRR
jgi:hypothetical protein